MCYLHNTCRCVQVFNNTCLFDLIDDRLRGLLQLEEEQYLQEISSKQETVLERQAKMRERARMLKERRESERLALVEKKLDQRWRYMHVHIYGETNLIHSLSSPPASILDFSKIFYISNLCTYSICTTQAAI